MSLLGHASPWVVVVAVLALGLFNVFDGPARQSLISSLVDRRHHPGRGTLPGPACSIRAGDPS